MALLGLAAITYLAWGTQTRLSTARLARRLEELGAWRHGTLTALLDTAAAGTSGQLLDLADRAQAEDVARRGAAAVEPIARPVRMISAAGLVCLGIGAAAFTTAGPVSGPAAALWHPHRAWEATVAPVRLRAAENLVDRGQPVDLHLEAMGRKAATLWFRAPGEAWKAWGVRLDSLGRATISTPPLQSDLFARLTSGGRSSDTVIVHVRLPVFLGTLNVIARYPLYLGLENEPVPRGTAHPSRGNPLEPGGSDGASRERRLAVGEKTESLSDRNRFADVLSPPLGEYRLALVTATGASLAGIGPLPIRLVRIAAGGRVPVPGADTLAPLSLQLPLIIDARDDHSITAVTLESRRISRLGLIDSARRESVPVPAERPDRAILTFTLDLNRRGLLPGDTVRYFATARDNTPRGQIGRSREFVLRLPTMSEVRAAQRRPRKRASLPRFYHQPRAGGWTADRLSGARARPSAGGLGESPASPLV